MTIRWLHLSDTHFREDELWDRRATLRALIAKVRELKEKGLAPDMVFVTGDIAWSGKPKEYEQATRFFTELNKVLELDPKDRWFLVPGNHDVDRSRITRAHRAITRSLQDEGAVEEILLKDPDSLRSLATRLDAYYAFAADFLGPARAVQPDRPWRTDAREFKGTSIGILQLNSAWIAEGGDADNANLIVGEAQVREALNDTPDTFLRIALMHHPLRNLREFDANRVESILGAKGGAAFLLRGHLHLNRTKVQSSPDGNLFELAAGALYTDETNWPRGVHLGEVDLDKGEARIHLFRHSAEGIGFFASDNLTYENAPNGISKIKLPAAYRFGGKKSKPAKTISRDQRLSFTARYRNAAAAYHGNARFIGFPNQAARPNARVSDLFVPMRMKWRGEKTLLDSRTTAAIAQGLLGAPQHGWYRIVVLGDPGSGKTTLSRFLVMLAAGVITMPGVEVIGEPLPLRITFRDFVERQRENPNLSLIDYLELQAKTELSLTLPKNFLRKAIDDGQAVLILDGLDEVGAPEHRAAMRDLVAAFSAAHGNLPMLITSRIAGYDEASLSGKVVEVRNRPHLVYVAFHHFVLERFDDQDLRTFVTHWYSVQEPTDPVARDRGIADLLAALSADERVRELARTPILATLIAMIHRVEANLPGERAKLYELCVRMLLETWPAQAKRPFDEIDPGLQRAYLESLAYEMQTGRTDYSSETVTISRKDLVAKLVPILRKRDFAIEPAEKVAGVIERWVDHLEKRSGLLIEQSTGFYSFFHLSIMEYLAAQGMERELGGNRSFSAITEHFNQAAWREVCLLAVGSHAGDADFLDSVYERVRKSQNPGRWMFLLRCLGEEARFQPEQRDTILGQCLGTVLTAGGWRSHAVLIDQIRRFSVRHGEATSHWIEGRLDRATGDELAATAAIAIWTDSEATMAHILNRRDRVTAAAALLQFWPGSQLGDWAKGQVDLKAALEWSSGGPQDLASLQAVASIGEAPDSIAATSVVALTGRTLRSCKEGARNIARVSNLLRTGGLGLPAYITICPERFNLATDVRAPLRLKSRSESTSPRFAGEPAHAFAGDFVRELANNFATNLNPDFVKNLTSAFDWAFSPFHANYSSGYFSVGAGSFEEAFASDFVKGFARALGRNIDFDINMDIAFTDSVSEPVHSMNPALNGAISEEDTQRTIRRLLRSMAGETWVALATMAISKNDDERLGYLLFRLQNRLLLEIWSAIDRRLPENPTPAQLALYFALGWAQSTTTWAWPDSERWRTLFAAGPGEHWLVRSQWHLCKLTDDPASKDDDAGLRAALRDGHRDESLPGYAARLSEVLGIEA